MIREFLKHLEDIKLTDIKVYDLASQSPFYEYFIIASGNATQAHATVSRIKNDPILKDAYVEGLQTNWILIEKDGIVVHLFVGSARDEYNLDQTLRQFLIQ